MTLQAGFHVATFQGFFLVFSGFFWFSWLRNPWKPKCLITDALQTHHWKNYNMSSLLLELGIVLKGTHEVLCPRCNAYVKHGYDHTSPFIGIKMVHHVNSALQVCSCSALCFHLNFHCRSYFDRDASTLD